jgi:diketogulonate reductase-like aldo/keto reductase
VATVRGLQEAVRQGLVRAMGVANFEQRHLQDVLDAGLALPAVNQLEFHPFWHQVLLFSY